MKPKIAGSKLVSLILVVLLTAACATSQRDNAGAAHDHTALPTSTTAPPTETTEPTPETTLPPIEASELIRKVPSQAGYEHRPA
jgi:uncharacterized lipoprotein